MLALEMGYLSWTMAANHVVLLQICGSPGEVVVLDDGESIFVFLTGQYLEYVRFWLGMFLLTIHCRIRLGQVT